MGVRSSINSRREGMKILVWADLHLHTWSQFGVDKTGMPKRLAEQRDVLKQITKLDKSRKIDLNIFAGDWFHKVGEHPTEVLHVTREYFEENKTPQITVDGNHDIIKRIEPESFHNAGNIIRGYAPLPNKDSEFKLAVVNYQDEVNESKLKGYDIVVLHKQPHIWNKHNYEFEGIEWEKLAKNNKLVFFGHYHTRLELAKNCFVIGTPMHLTFGDEGDRGVYIVDTEDWSAEFVKLNYPEFKTVAKATDVKEDGNYYRVLDAEGLEPSDNVIGIRQAPIFKERIKSDNFQEILREWLKISDKDDTWLEPIKDIAIDPMRVFKNVFKGRLKLVSISNFMSVEKADYDLENGFTFIAGGGNGTGSNGSGKTTIFGESIFWALFGKTSKGLTGNDVIRRGKKDCMVSLRLADGMGDVIVNRSRKGGLEVVQMHEGKMKDIVAGMREDDKQRLLEETVLGFDEQLFQTACYFSQEGMIMLTGLSDSKRTDMITNLLGFEMYDGLYDKVFEKQKAMGIEQEELKDKAESVKHDLEMLDKQIEIAVTHRNEYVSMAGSAEKDAENHKSDIGKLRKELEDTGQKDVDTHKKDIDKLHEELKGAEQQYTQDDGIDYDVVIKEQDVVVAGIKDSIADMKQKVYEQDWPGKISEANKRMGSLMSEQLNTEKHIPVLENEIERLTKMDQGVRCDKCGNMITADSAQGFIKEKRDKVEEYRKIDSDYDDLIGKVRVEIEGLEKAATGANAEIPLFEKKLDKVREGIKQLYDKKSDQARRTAQRDKEITRITNLIESAEADWKFHKDMAISRVKNLIESTQRMCDKAVELQKDYLARSEREAHEEGKLHSNRIAKDKQAKELEWRVESNTKGIEALDFWKVAFSAKGIRSVLLDRFCNEFNGIANDYLATASKGMMSIIVSPLAKLKSDEERNKIDIRVFIGEDDVRYESLSGGEKRRVDIALCMALNKWVSNKYQIPNGLMGLMILDEMFSFVDRMGEESIATLLYEEGQTKSILVISHTPELESYATRVYHVTKENGVSHLDTEKVVPRKRNEKQD